MAKRYFLLKHPETGELYSVTHETKSRGKPRSIPGHDGWKVLAELEALPGEFDIVQEDGSIVRDFEREADVMAGTAHIIAAHAQKGLEAALILSGYDLTVGLIADEAKAIGSETKALARRVMEKSADFRAAEIARRKAKIKGRL